MVLHTFADSSEPTRIRTFCVSSLANIGGPQATSVLIGLLKRGDRDIAESAAAALGEMKCKEAVAPLIEALLRDYDDNSLIINESAAISLGKIGDRQALDPLLKAMKFDYWIARAAARSLGKIGDRRAVLSLAEVVHARPHEDVTEAAIESLGELRDVRAVSVLIEALHYGDPHSVVRACNALAEIHDERAISHLIRLVREDSGIDGEEAMHALVTWGPRREIIAALKAALDDPNRAMVDAAKEALTALGPYTCNRSWRTVARAKPPATGVRP